MADAKVWAQRVKAWRASGMTAADFVDGAEYAESTLRYWAWRLAKAVPTPKAPPRFVRLVPRREAAPSSGRPPVEAAPAVTIELGGARVTVGVGFDRAALRDLLGLLRETEPAT